MPVNVETLKVNVTTVVAIVIASFTLYFSISALVKEGVIVAKEFAISLDIERDQDAAEMYRFRIQEGVANPNDPSRMTALHDKIGRRIAERYNLRR